MVRIIEKTIDDYYPYFCTNYSFKNAPDLPNGVYKDIKGRVAVIGGTDVAGRTVICVDGAGSTATWNAVTCPIRFRRLYPNECFEIHGMPEESLLGGR